MLLPSREPAARGAAGCESSGSRNSQSESEDSTFVSAYKRSVDGISPWLMCRASVGQPLSRSATFLLPTRRAKWYVSEHSDNDLLHQASSSLSVGAQVLDTSCQKHRHQIGDCNKRQSFQKTLSNTSKDSTGRDFLQRIHLAPKMKTNLKKTTWPYMCKNDKCFCFLQEHYFDHTWH